MKRFLIRLVIFSSVLVTLAMGWNYFMPEHGSPHLIYIILYFFTVSAFIHYVLLKANEQSPQHFVRSYMVFAALKLLLNLLVIIFYIFFHRAQAMVFIVSFLVIYFLFLVFEVILLQKSLLKK